MAAIAAATSPLQAYQREASRLTPPVSRLAGKVVTRDAGVSLGPFSVRFSAKDYELDLGGLDQTASFSDALDAAGLNQTLAAALPETPSPGALTRRQAAASYAATRDRPLETPPVMFSATV